MKKVILFESVRDPEEIAYMLGRNWDNCNTVKFDYFDEEAFSLAIVLCQVGTNCELGDFIEIIEYSSDRKYITSIDVL